MEVDLKLCVRACACVCACVRRTLHVASYPDKTSLDDTAHAYV